MGVVRRAWEVRCNDGFIEMFGFWGLWIWVEVLMLMWVCERGSEAVDRLWNNWSAAVVVPLSQTLRGFLIGKNY